VEAQEKVARQYFDEGSVDAAIPPLKILLHIMAYGKYEGKDLSNPELRKYFQRNYVIESDWYKERLILKQQKESGFLKNQIQYLNDFISNPTNSALVSEMKIHDRLEKTKMCLARVESEDYIKSIIGTIGADPLFIKN
jgi:hypothetical protein